jgi:RNA polymerase sigma-70 factor, ECF subfamily
MTLDERELVRRFQRGEPGSFETLYDRYGNRVYRFCFRLCGHTADAEDLAQEVFVAAYQGLERFEGRSTLATWLFRIALFRWKRLYGRGQPETVPLDEGLEVAATAPNPAFVGVERLLLDQALAALPPDLHEAFLLVKVEGLKYREAAVVLGVPQGTVQSRVHEAVVSLRRVLNGGVSNPARLASPAIGRGCEGGLGHEV